MFDHVKIGVSDFALSKAFYLSALEPLGVTVAAEGEPAYGVELVAKGPTSFILFQTAEKPAHLHLAFTAASREQVDEFYRAAMAAGARDNGAPGFRPEYHAGYYAAFVIGPDGHNIEAVWQGPREAVEVSRVAACSCGQLKAEVKGEPLRISICHCLACQRRTGSVFGVQARFPRENVTISGDSTAYARTGDSGSTARFHFCPSCGATVYYELEIPGDFIGIPVGAFADPGFPAPMVSVYEERMHSWVVPPADAEHMP